MTHSAKANTEQKGPVVVGNMKMWIGTITITSYSRAAGGELLVASDFGLKQILDVRAQPFVKSSTVGPVIPMWTGTRLKLICTTVVNSELANAATVASIRLDVYGK